MLGASHGTAASRCQNRLVLVAALLVCLGAKYSRAVPTDETSGLPHDQGDGLETDKQFREMTGKFARNSLTSSPSVQSSNRKEQLVHRLSHRPKNVNERGMDVNAPHKSWMNPIGFIRHDAWGRGRKKRDVDSTAFMSQFGDVISDQSLPPEDARMLAFLLAALRSGSQSTDWVLSALKSLAVSSGGRIEWRPVVERSTAAPEKLTHMVREVKIAPAGW